MILATTVTIACIVLMTVVVTAWCMAPLKTLPFPLSTRPARITLAAAVVLGTVGWYVSIGFPYLPLGFPINLLAGVVGQSEEGSEDDFVKRRTLHQLTQKLELKLAQTPNDVEGWLALARALMVQERYEDAIDIYQAWLRLLPQQHEIKVYLATCLVGRSGGCLTADAIALLEAVPATSPLAARAQRLRRGKRC